MGHRGKRDEMRKGAEEEEKDEEDEGTGEMPKINTVRE